MSETLRPDICVIGAGAAGLSVAAGAAALGVSCVLVEKAAMGGDCLNAGCVPSKALLAMAARAKASGPVDFASVRQHLRNVHDAIAVNDSAARFTAMGVRVVQGTACFTGPDTLGVGEFTIAARRFVVATGSRPAVPAIEGLDAVSYLTNESIFTLEALPRHLIIIGAGPIGLEMAQAFRRLGSEVSVFEAGRALGRDDREAASIVLHALRDEGITIHEQARIMRIVPQADGIGVVVGEGVGEHLVSGSHLLVATGRQPVTDGLGLDVAGVEVSRHGIEVDQHLKTRNRRIYAAGDVLGGLLFSHAANYHAGVILKNALFRLPAVADPAHIPWSSYTAPPLARAGLSEEKARNMHGEIRILRWPFAENDRAVCEGDTSGFIKVFTTRRGKVLGAVIVGRGADDLIGIWALAARQGMNIRTMADCVFPYPTRGEISKRVAGRFFAPSLSSPFLRRALSFLRKFG